MNLEFHNTTNIIRIVRQFIMLWNEKATKKELTETSPCPSHSKEGHALSLVSPQPLYNLKQQNQNQYSNINQYHSQK